MSRFEPTTGPQRAASAGRARGRAGDFHHADEDSDHGEITTVDGAEVLIVGAIDDYLPGF
ncbi:MAG: hypothetical protein KA371_09330 [Acidobacteria bacterium]|jgi:hypothetical protein|nr:hypothetical protein [Acidobacteriota bacterium]